MDSGTKESTNKTSKTSTNKTDKKFKETSEKNAQKIDAEKDLKEQNVDDGDDSYTEFKMPEYDECEGQCENNNEQQEDEIENEENNNVENNNQKTKRQRFYIRQPPSTEPIISASNWKEIDIDMHAQKAWNFFREKLGSPRYVCAPMVDQSELAFRMLVRNYGTDLCYSPMLHARMFTVSQHGHKTCVEDKPLVVQFSGNDPQVLVKAARYVENGCAAVDLNLGCPQHIARAGHYGAFLMESPNTVETIVRTLYLNLKVPVFCKIRIWTDFERTLAFAKMLERAGCSLLTIHGRTKEQKMPKLVRADWETIRKIREQLKIPVIVNGNVRTKQDADEAIKYTGCVAAMSAETLLREPALFHNAPVDIYKLGYEYMDLAVKYQATPKEAFTHLCAMFIVTMNQFPTVRDRIFKARSHAERIQYLRMLEQCDRFGLTPPPALPQKPKSTTKNAPLSTTLEQGESMLSFFDSI